MGFCCCRGPTWSWGQRSCLHESHAGRSGRPPLACGSARSRNRRVRYPLRQDQAAPGNDRTFLLSISPRDTQGRPPLYPCDTAYNHWRTGHKGLESHRARTLGRRDRPSHDPRAIIPARADRSHGRLRALRLQPVRSAAPQCPRWDSNPQHADFKSDASADWATGAGPGAGRSHTLRPWRPITPSPGRSRRGCRARRCAPARWGGPPVRRVPAPGARCGSRSGLPPRSRPRALRA